MADPPFTTTADTLNPTRVQFDMLRVTQQSSPAAAKSYYSAADYYAEGRNLPGRWGGLGAERLGLSGEVQKLDFDRLCDNLDPDTGRPLTARTRSDRTVGYDFTFSVPKSVSLAYAVGGDDRILDAFRAAVGETMADVEAEMKTRVRVGGRNEERVTGNLAWAEFVHLTSRPVGGVPDPHLHAHVFAFNATFDDVEGRWKAGQFRELKRDAPYWQAAFRAHLADRLQDLGYELTAARGDFELAGVSREAVRTFSRRTAAVEALAAELGIDDPEAKGKLGATSREAKARHLSWPTLVREWTDRLAQADRERLAPAAVKPPTPERADAAAVRFAVDHVFATTAVADEKKLLTEALRHGVGRASVAGVRREFARLQLPAVEQHGRRRVTTPEVLAEEGRMLAFARDGRGTARPLAAPERPLKRDWLNAGQRKAVRHVLTSRDRVVLVRGAAGTGKTTLMQEAVEAIRDAGKRVTVLAPSAAASRGVLRAEGFEQADTVARFLIDRDFQAAAAGGVIWVDEAGLLGNRDLAGVFAAADRLDARVVLMGDRRQHGAVARGSPLRLLETEAGLPSVAVTDILRQSGEYKKAVRLLERERTADGLAALDRLGWVREVADADRYSQLAEAYLAAAAERAKDGSFKTALVVTPTHAEAARITAAVRSQLTADDRLRDERTLEVLVPKHLSEAERGEASSFAAGDVLQFHRHAPGHPSGSRLTVDQKTPVPVEHAARFQAYRPAQLRVAAGDRLRVTANGRTKDGRHRLDNGAIVTVAGFTERGDVRLTNGWVVAADFGHLAHGYAVTSHSAQGRTVDTVLVGQSAESFPASSRRQFYVSVSRGRERAILFTDDKAGLAAAITRGDESPTATEVFRPAPARSPRPSPPERLKKHLAFVRRAVAHQWEGTRPVSNRVPEREVTYDR